MATYIREVFIHLIDDYFPFTTFVKSTGDGLLMTVHFDRTNVVEMVRKTATASLRAVDEFAGMTKGNPMITFPTPPYLGVGLARGTTCCLVSDGRILDYSGHLLNLASRLMDLGRPSGVIMDGTFGYDLLDDDTQAQFEPAEVYIRGVAENQSHPVYIQKDHVVLPDYALKPMNVVPLPSPEKRQASGQSG